MSDVPSIECEADLAAFPPARWRRLMGPFGKSEADLCRGAMTYLVATGATISLIREPGGAVIWRLRSECETMQQTGRRLIRQTRTAKN